MHEGMHPYFQLIVQEIATPKRARHSTDDPPVKASRVRCSSVRAILSTPPADTCDKLAERTFLDSLPPEVQAMFVGVPLQRQGIRVLAHDMKRDGRQVLHIEARIESGTVYHDMYRCETSWSARYVQILRGSVTSSGVCHHSTRLRPWCSCALSAGGRCQATKFCLLATLHMKSIIFNVQVTQLMDLLALQGCMRKASAPTALRSPTVVAMFMRLQAIGCAPLVSGASLQ
jgi:hypothetical protein